MSWPRQCKAALAAMAICLSLICPDAVALSGPECANAFTLVQIDQLKLRDSGRIEVYLVLPGAAHPLRHHVAPVLTPSSKAVFLCDRDLLASVAEHPYLRPQTSLTIEEAPSVPGGRLLPWREWLGVNRKVYMHKEDDGAESVQYRNGFVEVHDNTIRRIDPAALPGGWDDTRNQEGPYLHERKKVFTATRWRRFNVDQRIFVTEVPVESSCGSPLRGMDRTVIGCNGHFTELNLDDGSRRMLLHQRDHKPWTRLERGGYSGPWVVGRQVVRAYHHQPPSGWEEPAGLIQLVEASGPTPAREELAAEFPSRKIAHAQALRDRLLLISRPERTAWLFDPGTRTFTKHDIPLSPDATNIAAISFTRDFLLVAETLPPRDGWPAGRLLILDRAFKLVHRLDLRGTTESITTTERPWPASQSRDGFRFTLRGGAAPGGVGGAGPRRQ